MGIADQVGRAGAYAKALYGWRWVFARTMGYCTVSLAARTTGEAIPQRLMRVYLDGALRQLNINLVAEGAEKIKPATPCVLAVNHNSMLDIPCVGVLLDFDYKWVAKKEVFQLPFIGWHLWACGHISVDRQRRDNLKRLERAFHDAISRGASILMFPEGTRSEDGALRPFKKGAFITAIREQIPVVPIALNGTERLLEKHSIEFPSGPRKLVQVKVMDPIAPPLEGDFDARVTALLDDTRAAMVRALDDLRGEPGAAERPTL